MSTSTNLQGASCSSPYARHHPQNAMGVRQMAACSPSSSAQQTGDVNARATTKDHLASPRPHGLLYAHVAFPLLDQSRSLAMHIGVAGSPLPFRRNDPKSNRLAITLNILFAIWSFNKSGDK